jgi:hypothetical protein
MNTDNNPIEKCVICGKDTPYRFNDHIDLRIGYVEGSGQGCYQSHMCSQERSRRLITISEELVYNTPNDQELGSKVRELYWNTKNK